MKATFSISVSYGQIAVFAPELEDPFNDWSETHINQGFAWRQGSVSFRTLEDGSFPVEVSLLSEYKPHTEVVRVIKVPYKTQVSGDTEIASISDSKIVELVPGNYCLYFEILSGINPKYRLIFIPTTECNAEIIVQDADLFPPDSLLMTAEPA